MVIFVLQLYKIYKARTNLWRKYSAITFYEQ